MAFGRRLAAPSTLQEGRTHGPLAEEDIVKFWALMLVIVTAPAVCALDSRSAHADPATYEIVTRMPVGGEGGWDYLTFDPHTQHLFVTRGSHVQVIDTGRDTVIADIPNTSGVHGVALALDLGRGFTSNGRDSSVTVFDSKTFETLTKVKLPARGPDDILYDPASKRVFTFNGGSSNATAIDPASNTVIGSVALGGRPEAAVTDGQGRVYVNLEDSSAVTCFDTRTLQVISRWSLAPGEGPTGLAMDRTHRRLFAGCANQKLIVLDADSGHVIADLTIGERCDGVGFDAGLQCVVSANGDGTLSAFREESPTRFAKLPDVPTQRGARTLAMDEVSHRIYTCSAQYGAAPAPTAEQPHPRAPMVPGSFVIIELAAQHAPSH